MAQPNRIQGAPAKNGTRETTTSYQQAVQDSVNQARESMTHARENVATAIEQQPITMVSAAFAIGLVAGAGLVALYCQSQSRRSYSNYYGYGDNLSQWIPDSVRQFPSNVSSMMGNWSR